MDENKNREEAKTFDDYLMTYLTDDKNILDEKDSVEKDKMLLEKENYDTGIQKKYFEQLEDEKQEENNLYEDDNKSFIEENNEDKEIQNNIYQKDNKNSNADFLPDLATILCLALVVGMVMIKGIGVFHGLESLLFLMLWASVLVYVSIIIHEGGHFVFGLLSGYKFASFRIANMMFIKSGKRLTYKKYHIPGTGGQCLMIPPDIKSDDYDFPYVLYSFGGVIFNLLFGIICFLLYISLPYIIVLSEGFIVASALSLYFAMLNGIPRRVGGIANDGANALYLDEDLNTKKAFYAQLKINGLLTKGIRYKDMDERLFEVDEKTNCKNPLVSAMFNFRVCYLMDKREFDKARELIEYALNNIDDMLSVHKSEIKSELFFLELIGDCRDEKITQIYDEDLKRYIEVTQNYYISRRRQLYAYELLYNKDEEKAREQLDAFKVIGKNYPYEVEIDGEIELLHLVHDKALEREIIEEDNKED